MLSSNITKTLTLVIVMTTISSLQAFVPNSSTTKFSMMKRSNFIMSPAVAGNKMILPGGKYDAAALILNALKMAGEEGETKTEETKASGDLYDDEVAPYKDPLSDSMRQRLMREASSGLDSNQKQNNVILYVCVGVAALVLLGGQGILY